MFPEPPLVLVTGGTGFLALWVITLLLRQNYRVRTTVRNLTRTAHIHSCLVEAGLSTDQISSLEIIRADLLSDDNWPAAVAGTTYIQHIASPFPAHFPKDLDAELIRPAREGTLRVLHAARDSRTVKRVVLTSSSAAVAYGHEDGYAGAGGAEQGFTEADWTNLDSRHVLPYQRSKTLAERAAWEFIETASGNKKDANANADGQEEALSFDLVVVNPVTIFGPALGKEDGTSLRTLVELLQGNAPGIPKLYWPIVDVRDCARMHLLAMTTSSAGGERFLCVGEGSLWTEDIAKILKRRFGQKARKVPTIVLPNFAIRVVALVWPVVKLVLPELGHEKRMSNVKAREVLKWDWEYNSEEAVVAGAESLFKFGVIQA
jgi:dihydroflavonol-4-reductase